MPTSEYIGNVDPAARARLQNLEDVRAGWASLLTRVPWDQFITLTFDPNRFPRGGQESWLSAWRWFQFNWLGSCAEKAGQAWRDQAGRWHGSWANAWRHGRGRPMWALALEPHRDDRLHAHVLLRMTRELPWLDWKLGSDLWWANRGRCWFERPRSREHVCAYVAKYVLKSGSDSVFLSDNFDAPRMTAALAAS